MAVLQAVDRLEVLVAERSPTLFRHSGLRRTAVRLGRQASLSTVMVGA